MKASLLLLSLVLLVPSSLFAQATPQFNYLQKTFGMKSEATAIGADSVISVAKAQLGKKYIYGEENPNRGFDCSGFTQFLMKALNVKIPRTASQQARIGDEIPTEKSYLKVGDLLTFGKNGRITHVGVYIGNGRFIHASSGAGEIVEAPLKRGLGKKLAWMGVRRVIKCSDCNKEGAL